MYLFGKTPNPDSKINGANMGPTSDKTQLHGPHVAPMNLAIWEAV